MTTPDGPARKAVYTALTTPKLMLSGKEVKVFDGVAGSGTPYPYIILDGQQNLPDHTKDHYGWEHYLTLRIVSGGMGVVTGRDAAEKVMDLLLPRLTPLAPGGVIPFDVTGWRLWKTAVTSKDLPQISVGDGSNVYNKIVTVTLNIYK